MVSNGVTYSKIGQCRNKPRVWLEGALLSRANFNRNTEIYIRLNPIERCIDIFTTNEGPSLRTVSGRITKKGVDLPIIDINNHELLDVTRDADLVCIEAKPNHIRITIHHYDLKREARESSIRYNLYNGFLNKGVLCGGIGVSAAASHDALKEFGIESKTLLFVDRERSYVDAYAKNNHTLSASTLVANSTLEELEDRFLIPLNMMIFSLPCSGHTKSGKAKNKNSIAEMHPTDATAVFGLIKAIEKSQPAILSSENVVEGMHSATYSLIKTHLKNLGYVIYERILNRDDTNTFENRERYWFVAVSKGLPKLNIDNFPTYATSYDNLHALICDADCDVQPEDWRDLGKLKLREKNNAAKGNSFKLNLVNESSKQIGVCGRGYSKDRATEPHIEGQNNTYRLLKPVELSLAQEVPTHLIDGLVDTIAYEGLGQGVDYRQAKGISHIIARDILLPLMSEVDRMPTATGQTFDMAF
jgi:DNA (cytosine-5)-methyltransferase 1